MFDQNACPKALWTIVIPLSDVHVQRPFQLNCSLHEGSQAAEEEVAPEAGSMSSEWLLAWWLPLVKAFATKLMSLKPQKQLSSF